MTLAAATQVRPIAGDDAALLRLLGDALGAEFALRDAPGEFESDSGEWAGSPRIAISQIDADHARVAVKLGGHEPRIAVGLVTTRDASLLRRFADSLLQQHRLDAQQRRQSSEFDDCLDQLAHQLDAQNWLRTLAEQLRVCDAGGEFIDVAQGSLRTLRRLLRAQSVALFTVSKANSGEKSQRAIWLGEQLGPDHIWEEWLWEGIYCQLGWRLKIAGESEMHPQLARHGVRTLISVPLVCAGQMYGWLIAVNRQPAPHDDAAKPGFGPTDASLIDAAATLIATHGHNVDLLRDRDELTLQVLESVTSAGDARDPFTRGHSRRVAGYSRLLASKLQSRELPADRAYLCGLLHDIGKVGLGNVTLAGRRVEDTAVSDPLCQHPEIGKRMLQGIDALADVLPAILHHHERFDGRGYPAQLVGDAIPLSARIVAVTDHFDELTTSRPSRPALLHAEALRRMRQAAGSQFDPAIVDVLGAVTVGDLREAALTPVPPSALFARKNRAANKRRIAAVSLSLDAEVRPGTAAG